MGDLYEVLGVGRNASADEIKRSYRRLAKKNHPDMNPGDQAAEERFKAASHAFEILSDPEKRKLYDEFGEEATRPGFDADKARSYRQWQGYGRGGGFGGFDFSDTDSANFGDMGDIFSSFFGGRRGYGAGPTRGANTEARMEITLREAVLGGEREISVQRGDGTLRTLRVKIPAGIKPGQSIRLSGQGMPGRAGAPAGDLLIQVDVAAHPVLKREGQDLHLDLPVTVGEALLGAQVEVPTLTGSVRLTLPPGSQNGTKLRLRGKGAPASGRQPAGDLYVRLDVRLPPVDGGRGEKVKKAIQTLEAQYGTDVRRDLRL